ncbi:MAG: histidine phosphatase family protein [Alphaproteobacteria bacterium]|nr:histidine phosphatase family protein [Alphaproteobacteria bacterium]
MPEAALHDNAEVDPSGRAATPPGSITIARHGRPAADRSVRLDWREFIEWWSAYDQSGLTPGQAPPAALVERAQAAAVLFSSTLPRAMETARAVAEGRAVLHDPIFVEAPMPPPPWPGRLSPRAWGVLARCAWWLGRAAGQETRTEAEQRAEAAVATLTARALRGDNVLLLAHGWFNRMMRPVLRAQGWRCIADQGDTYWSFRVYVKRR